MNIYVLLLFIGGYIIGRSDEIASPTGKDIHVAGWIVGFIFVMVGIILLVNMELHHGS